MLNALRIANLSLLILFPIAWFAPLLRAALLPIFGMDEISVISGLQSLWESDVILALIVSGAPNAILVAGGYLLINNFLGNFIEPVLVGKRFGISTLVVIISVMFWGWVWGPFGMLLAVPLTMTLKVFLDGSEELRWLGVAIAGGKSGDSMAITRKLEKAESSADEKPAKESDKVGA